MNTGSNNGSGGGPEGDVAVSVITPSGIFPSEDTLQRVPTNTAVSAVLRQAAAALELTDTSDWVVHVGGRPVDVNDTFKKTGLRCIVDLVWQPREGGGGA